MYVFGKIVYRSALLPFSSGPMKRTMSAPGDSQACYTGAVIIEELLPLFGYRVIARGETDQQKL